MDFLKKAWEFILNDKVFITIIAIFIITTAVVTCVREGKDLKVGLYGVVQMLHRQSLYDNPTDTNRPIFRYAPGITILQAPFLMMSEPAGPYEFKHILPSVFSWYLFEILAFLLSVFLIMKLFPAASAGIGRRNLKISILLAMPLIAYELSNSQNKLVALAFILLAIYMFEKDKQFLSAVFLSLAVTVYIPLAFFSLYFILRSRGIYIVNLILGGLVIFIVVPSAVWGIDYNNFALKDWYTQCLKPFFLTTSYATYMELRPSSQSLPSAIARIFVSGRHPPYKYLISPQALHILIRFFSTTILVISALAAWRRVKPKLSGLSYMVFLPLALITPSYCIWYTWAWSFVLCFAVLNYISYPGVTAGEKKILAAAVIVLIVATYSIAIGPLNNISVMFWGTLFYWACVTAVVLKGEKA